MMRSSSFLPRLVTSRPFLNPQLLDLPHVLVSHRPGKSYWKGLLKSLTASVSKAICDVFTPYALPLRLDVSSISLGLQC